VVLDLLTALAVVWVLWRVWSRPQRWGPKVNVTTEGVVVSVKRGGQEAEVGRVGFRRELTVNPDVEFDEQLAIVLARARERCSTLNATERNVANR